jgi:hypothetical protein
MWMESGPCCGSRAAARVGALGARAGRRQACQTAVVPAACPASPAGRSRVAFPSSTSCGPAPREAPRSEHHEQPPPHGVRCSRPRAPSRGPRVAAGALPASSHSESIVLLIPCRSPDHPRYPVNAYSIAGGTSPIWTRARSAMYPTPRGAGNRPPGGVRGSSCHRPASGRHVRSVGGGTARNR